MNKHDLQRQAFASILDMQSVIRSFLPVEREMPRVFYGGARGGEKGGPQVKINLLRARFPQNFSAFNLIYLLSGALYIPTSALARLRDRGIPVVLNQNGVFYPAWAPDVWEKGNSRMADAMRQSDYVLYQSEFCRRCADRFLGVKPAAFEILYNAVDTSLFTPPQAQPLHEAFTFLVSGNISATTFYRLINSVDALADARRHGLNVKMMIAGFIPDELKPNLYSHIGKSGVQDHVSIHGPYKRHEAPDLYREADAYLITKHNDPCPNVVLEALASGLPVLYSSSGGTPELVGPDAGVGLAVPDTFDEQPVPHATSIAEGMAQILENRVVFAAAARRRAEEKFALTHWLDRHQNIFMNLIQGRS